MFPELKLSEVKPVLIHTRHDTDISESSSGSNQDPMHLALDLHIVSPVICVTAVFLCQGESCIKPQIQLLLMLLS